MRSEKEAQPKITYQITQGIKMRRILNLLFTLAFIAAACSSEPDLEIPADVEALENVQVYSKNTEPLYELLFSDSLVIDDQSGIFFSGRISAMDNEQGEIFVTDFMQRTIFHFSEDGDFIRQYGREGSGPGEFTGIQYPAVRNSILYAYDYGPRRLNLYDTSTGDLIRDFNIMHEEDGKGQWRLNGYHIMEDGNLLARMTRHIRPDGEDPAMDNRLMLINPEGEFLDDNYFQLEEPPSIYIGGTMTVRPQFMSWLVLRINDNGLFHGTTDRVLIHQADLPGNYIGAFFYDLVGEPVTQGDIKESTEGFPPQFVQLVEQADLPDRWPVWDTFHVDDQSRIWISLRSVDEDSDTTVWWVLDSSGEKLAIKELPSQLSISAIRDNHLYASTLNEEGSRVIVRYSFEL